MKVTVTILLLSLCFNSIDLRAMQKGEEKLYFSEKKVSGYKTIYRIKREFDGNWSTGTMIYNSEKQKYKGEWNSRVQYFGIADTTKMDQAQAEKYYKLAEKLESQRQ